MTPPGVDDLDEALRAIEALAAHPRVRGVGETGLDHFRTGEDGRAVQEHSFRAHIAIAKRYGKPLVIHDRDAHADVLRVLDDEGAPEQVVMHCFSGDADFAVECVKRGFVLSFAGTVTFANAADLREAARVTPPDAILVETDAPYLTPMPYRGRPNGSYLIPLTVRALADTTGLDLVDALRGHLGHRGAGFRAVVVVSRARRPPGPRGHWLLGSLSEIRSDMPGTLIDVSREYGGVVRLRVGPAAMYLISDGPIIVDLLTRRAGELRKSNRTRQSLGGHLGDGLVTLEGEPAPPAPAARPARDAHPRGGGPG